jgi:fumarylacetoacetate (FAA) hydrolase family protein
MGEIKKYEKLTMIILKDGETILTPMTVDEMEAIIAKREFIRVGDDIFHKYDIKRVKPYIVDGIDNFILSQDKDMQEKIRSRMAQMFERT